MDEAPMLYIGERVGNRKGPKMDVAVDPLEGTETVASGLNNALSVIAAAPRGTLLHAPDIYMHKLAVGPELAGKLSLNDPIEVTLRKASEILSAAVGDDGIHSRSRATQRDDQSFARVRGKNQAAEPRGCHGSDRDLHGQRGRSLCGLRRSPEGVLAAAALKCLGGEIQGRLIPETPEDFIRCQDMGLKHPEQLLTMEDMVGGEGVLFVATGVTAGDFLRGVKFMPGQRAETHSVMMYSGTRTVRYIRSVHHLFQSSETLAAAASS